MVNQVAVHQKSLTYSKAKYFIIIYLTVFSALKQKRGE